MLWDPTLTAAGPFQSPRASPQQLEDLRAYLKKAEQFGQSTKEMVPVVPFGIAEIDRHLPTGGLVQDALPEQFAENHADIGAVTVFCITILIRLLSIEDQNPKRPILWCLQNQVMDTGDFYPSGFAHLGLNPAHIFAVRTKHDTDALWVMEEALRCGVLCAVVGELKSVDLTASRRLQLAAKAGNTMPLLLRPVSDTLAPSAAATRWQIAANSSKPRGWAAELNEPGPACWRANLFRCRGGTPGNWTMEWCDETGDLALAAPVCNRPDSSCNTNLTK